MSKVVRKRTKRAASSGVLNRPRACRSRAAARFLGKTGGHPRLEEAGEDAVDPDIARAEFLRETFGELDQTGLAGGVGGLSDGRMQGGIGVDLDDVPLAPPHHATGGGAAQRKAPFRFVSRTSCQFLLLESGEGLISGDAGVVDEHVDSMVTFEIGLTDSIDRTSSSYRRGSWTSAPAPVTLRGGPRRDRPRHR